MEVVILIGILVAFVGVAWFLAKWFEEQRSKEYAGVARKLGLGFSAMGEPALLESLGHFSLFQAGHAKQLRNVIRGQTQNVDVALFDYSYTTGGGNSSSTHRQTVVRFESPWLALPKFELRPAHLGHRVAKLFGYQDIAISEFPLFSKKYLLRGDNEEAIRQVFTEETIRFLEPLNGLWVFGERSKLLIYRAGKRLRGYELRGFLEEAFGVYAQFKTVSPSEVS
jgi:hypothetical protein